MQVGSHTNLSTDPDILNDNKNSSNTFVIVERTDLECLHRQMIHLNEGILTHRVVNWFTALK